MAQSEDILSFLNYNQMVDDTRELLTSDKWILKIEHWPNVVYNPGEVFLQTRVKAIGNLNASTFHSAPLNTSIRGFETHVQPGQTELKNVSCEWTLLDMEDQSIYILFSDWCGKSCDPTTQRSYRATDLRGNFIYQRLNSVNLVVREWVHKGCIPETVEYPDKMDGKRSLVGDEVKVKMKGILFPPTFKNLNVV